MKVCVSESLAYTGEEVLQQHHSYDVSIIYIGDKASWMERSARSVRPHYVRSLKEGELVLKMYKEYLNGPQPDHSN
jgi:hypothetical protein